MCADSGHERGKYYVRRIQRSVVGLALGAVVGTTITACFDKDQPDEPVPGPVFAYQDRSGFAVMANDRQLVRVDGAFLSVPAWTSDGTHVGAIRSDEDSPELRRIIIVEVASGQRREVVCGCFSFAGIGGSKIAWVDAAGSLHSIDASVDDAPSPIEVELPAGFTAESVVAGNDGLLLVQALPTIEDAGAVLSMEQGGTVYAVSAGGVPVLASGFDPVSEAVSATVFGRRFAYGVVSSRGDCAHWGDITVFDAASGAVTATDMVAARHTGPNGSEVAVEDLWWDADGTLRASLSLVTCNPDGGEIAVPASQWKLADTVWVREDRATATRERPLPGGGRITISGDGTLRLITGEGSLDVAAGARSLSVPMVGPA